MMLAQGVNEPGTFSEFELNATTGGRDHHVYHDIVERLFEREETYSQVGLTGDWGELTR
jgi:hypothetical protein